LVVEVAALDAESDSSFSSMIQLPRGAAMSAGATGVNKLTTGFMRQPHHPEFQAAYPQFSEFLRQRTEAAGQGGYLLLIGHNIASEHTHVHYLQLQLPEHQPTQHAHHDSLPNPTHALAP
jgi:hypothetical protein